jgi:hypothetical protein
MTTLTLDVPSKLYQRLHEEAKRLGKTPQAVVQELLVERLAISVSTLDDRREILRKAGLLTELGPNLRQRAEASTATLEMVRATLNRSGLKSLSDIVLEQRRAREW